MKEPAVTSPFSAMNPREQKEQWICWQCAHEATATVSTKPTVQNDRSVSLPPLHLPNAEEAKPTECTKKPTESRFCAKPHHGQYDAVIRRLQDACQRAGRYTSCTAEVSSVRQEASGSENAEK